ncbi:unnamed protein product [Alopecurus aequalis]
MEAADEGTRCALCGAGADVHCAADAAFLCVACDAQVHAANFLASRHHRTRVPAPAKGRDVDVPGTSSTSFCLSTADSAMTMAMAAPRRRKPKTRPARGLAVLQRWAKHMGVVAPGAARQRAAGAARALQDVAAAPRMPLRIAMAAALWREVAAAHGTGIHEGADALRRLEACARVPARLVVAVASDMGRELEKRASAMDTEEGWGECS